MTENLKFSAFPMAFHLYINLNLYSLLINIKRRIFVNSLVIFFLANWMNDNAKKCMEISFLISFTINLMALKRKRIYAKKQRFNMKEMDFSVNKDLRGISSEN